MQNSYVRTCHDFAGAEQGDLSFKLGDVLYVDRQIDGNWCHGRSLTTGLNGIFPTNFVSKLVLPNLQEGEKKLFVAKERFIGQEQGDLSFLEGDIIVGMRAIDENWWEGEAGGRRGIFPLTLIIELNPPSVSSFSTAKNGHNAIDTRTAPLSVVTSVPNEVKAVVKHDLRPVDAQELELKAGETVIIEEFVDKFTCRGRTLDGRRGLFGKGFIEIIDQKSQGSAVASPVKPMVNATGSSSVRDSTYSTSSVQEIVRFDHSPKASSAPSKTPPKSIISPKPTLSPRQCLPATNASTLTAQEGVAPYGRTKYKFEAEYAGELPFSAGIIVQLIRHVDDEWTEGILDGRRGIFPTSYVDIVVDCPRMQLGVEELKSINRSKERSRSQDVAAARGVASSTSSSSSNQTIDKVSSSDVGKQEAHRIVKFDFMGVEDGDLTAFKGDSITAIRRINDEWLEARHNITSQVGAIPLAFVEASEPAVKWRQLPLQDNDSSRSSATSSVLDATIAQNIRRLEDNSHLSARKEKPRWSPLPGSTAQVSPSVPSSNVNATTLSAISPMSPWSTQSVNTSSSPTVPQQSSRQSRELPNVQKRSTPPPRPAVPAALKMRQETASQHLELQRQQAKEQKKIEMRNQRTRIIQEIITTERDYCRDLSLFKETILSKRNMLDSDGLLGGPVWSHVIDLSAKLLSKLEEEFGKDFVYQEVGSSFLALDEAFKSVYGAFCQSYEEAQSLLDKYETEPEKQIVLKDMLVKIQQRTTCIDLSTMLSRPVQRVLKYPLFLSELLKCTEDNQSDKVQLMKALKVMTEVAQIMNESKRRKDLVTKYRGDGDVTFTERLSRFTLHSVRKKGTRLSMRLSSTIGLTQLAKDDQFEEAERQFRAVDRCCRGLLRDIQSYCEQVVVLYNHKMSIADAIHYGIYNGGAGGCDGSPAFKKRSSQSQSSSIDDSVSPSFVVFAQLSGRYLESWSKVLLSESVLQKLFDSVNSKVRQPLAHIQHSCKGPEKLISKRRDKLLDYESVGAKLEKADNIDPLKINMLEEELRKAKAEYEAMNTQLLTELPQFNRLACEIITMAARAFIAAQRSFVYEFGRCFEQTIGCADTAATDKNALEKFQRKQRLVTENMGHLCFMSDGAVGSGKSSAALVKRQSSTVSRSSAVHQRSRPTITFPHKLQTEGERLTLRSQFGENKLFVVTRGYEASGDLELTLKAGDLVGVIVDKDPMGSDERWFVDNGMTKGFVPQDVLKPLTTDGMTLAASSGRLTTVELIDISSVSEKNARNSAPSVAAKKASLSSLPSTHQPRQAAATAILLTSDKRPVSPPQDAEQSVQHSVVSRGVSMPNSTRPLSLVGPFDKTSIVEYASVEKKAARRRAPSPPRNPQGNVTLHPIRPAPKPPSTVPSIAESNLVQMQDDGRRTSQEEEVEPAEFFVALYTFTANSENELSMTEGQILAVHDKKDLESNLDWWLVEDEDGALGYVPGNYLAPYTAERR